MRRIIAETKKVRAGDLVRISLRIGKDCDLGKVTIWARQGDDDFSPYINEGKIEASNVGGRPLMLKPMEFRLTEKRRHVSSEFFSEIDQQFRVVQEIDNKSDPKVKARIRRYGKTSTALRRYCGNALRSIRSRTATLFGQGQ